MIKLFLVALIGCALYGQTEKAQLWGTISDTSNALIPSARIAVRNLQSNDTGRYVVSFLDPGTYELVIPKEGPGGSGEQLFFLKNDPDEPRNLARDAGYARIRGEMPDRLLRSLIPADCPHTRKSLYGLGVFQPVARPAKDGMLR